MKLIYSLISLATTVYSANRLDLGEVLGLGQAAGGSGSGSANFKKNIVNLDYRGLHQRWYSSYRWNFVSKGFVMNTTMAGQNVSLVIDFSGNRTFIGTKTAINGNKANWGIECNDTAKCKSSTTRADYSNKQFYNDGWSGYYGNVSLMGSKLMNVSLVTSNDNGTWYFRESLGVLGLGPGSSFYDMIKATAAPTADYYITFKPNCDVRLQKNFFLKNDSKELATMCVKPTVEFGADKPSTPLLNMTAWKATSWQGSTYYTSWMATGIEATAPYTAFSPKGGSNPATGSPPSTLTLISKTDKVCIMPEQDFFMIANDKNTTKKNHFTWFDLAVKGTVCQGSTNIAAERNFNCNQTGLSVASGPEISMKLGGSGAITVYPQEYLAKMNITKMPSTFVNLIKGYGIKEVPDYLNQTLATNSDISTLFDATSGACGGGDVALGKWFFMHRDFTIGMDKDATKFSLTFAQAPSPPGEGGWFWWIVIGIVVIVVLLIVVFFVCGGKKSGAPLEEPLEGDFTVKFEN